MTNAGQTQSFAGGTPARGAWAAGLLGAAATLLGRVAGCLRPTSCRASGADRLTADLAGVLEHLPVPLGVTAIGPHQGWMHPDARVLFTNRRFTELFGYDADDIPTVRDWAERAYPDEAYRLEMLNWWDSQLQRLEQTGETASQESRITTRSGTVLDVVITALTLDGRLVVAFRDVSRENQTRMAMQQSERQLQEIIDAAPMPLSYRLSGGTRIRVNAAFTAFCGYSAADVPTIEDWFQRAYPDPEYRRHVLAVWEPLVERARETGGRVAPRLYRVTCKDGAVRDVEISGTLAGDTIIVQLVDLTERIRAEQVVREQREQLAHVQRAALLGELAAALAHELNQPLGAIQRNAEAAGLLLDRSPVDLAALRDIVTDIHRDDLRAGAVLDRIRNLLRRGPLSLEAMPVAALIADVIPLVHPAMATAGVPLVVSQESGLPPILADRVLAQQLLLNLLVNASEAVVLRGTGSVSLLVERAADDAVRISVSDTGGGVPRGMETRILEPFVSTKPDGMGMGLPIVATIVEEHAGSLRIDNEPGRGITMHVTLPAAGAALAVAGAT